MKSFEVKALGLEEMSIQEARNTDGGICWEVAIALTIIGLFIPFASAARNDGEYYGGELDPAVCVG